MTILNDLRRFEMLANLVVEGWSCGARMHVPTECKGMMWWRWPIQLLGQNHIESQFWVIVPFLPSLWAWCCLLLACYAQQVRDLSGSGWCRNDWKLEIAMPNRKITFPNQLSGASCHSKPGDGLIDKWKGRAIFDRHWHIPRALIQWYNLCDFVGLAGRL